MLSKQDILSAKDLTIEKVLVPEWGGEICVRGMTGTERDNFESSVVEFKGQQSKVNMKNLRAKLVTMTACDEEGNRLFEDADVLELGKKSATALNRVFEVAQRLSGLSKEDLTELEKN